MEVARFDGDQKPPLFCLVFSQWLSEWSHLSTQVCFLSAGYSKPSSTADLQEPYPSGKVQDGYRKLNLPPITCGECSVWSSWSRLHPGCCWLQGPSASSMASSSPFFPLSWADSLIQVWALLFYELHPPRLGNGVLGETFVTAAAVEVVCG